MTVEIIKGIICISRNSDLVLGGKLCRYILDESRVEVNGNLRTKYLFLSAE